MSSPDAAFETLLGGEATDGERQKLYRVRDTLGVKSTDSLWTLLLVLEYYLALYETLPQRSKTRRARLSPMRRPPRRPRRRPPPPR